jgi:L-rhamnose 1-dehydrogenase
MPGLLEGKATAITGGASGIGRAIALEYLRQGASVAVNHLGDASSNSQFESLVVEAKAGNRLIAVAGDISKPDTAQKLVSETVKAFGKLDVFVSNAGVCKFANFLEYVKASCSIEFDMAY